MSSAIAQPNSQSTPKKNSLYHIIIDQISGIFLPILNCLTAASIIKSAIVLLASFGLMSSEGGLYKILFAVSDGFFYYLPFCLAFTAAKKWNTDPFIALLIPIAMLYPDLNTLIEGGASLSLLGLVIPSTIYHSSVIPVILAVGLLHFIELPCDKYIPEAIRGFCKPIVCCLIVLPATFLFFGPLGTWIGDILTKIFFTLYHWNAIIAGAFMGFFMQPMVVVGAHWSVVPVSISNVATYGYDVIMPLVGAAVYGQSGAALAMALIYRDKEKKRIALQASLTAALGVTEPALFGVNVPALRPMLAACLAGAIGGGIVGAAGTHCNAFAFPSFLTSVAYVGPGFVTFLLSMVLGFILGFLFTIVQKKAITKTMTEKN